MAHGFISCGRVNQVWMTEALFTSRVYYLTGTISWHSGKLYLKMFSFYWGILNGWCSTYIRSGVAPWIWYVKAKEGEEEPGAQNSVAQVAACKRCHHAEQRERSQKLNFCYSKTKASKGIWRLAENSICKVCFWQLVFLPQCPSPLMQNKIYKVKQEVCKSLLLFIHKLCKLLSTTVCGLLTMS